MKPAVTEGQHSQSWSDGGVGGSLCDIRDEAPCSKRARHAGRFKCGEDQEAGCAGLKERGEKTHPETSS